MGLLGTRHTESQVSKRRNNAKPLFSPNLGNYLLPFAIARQRSCWTKTEGLAEQQDTCLDCSGIAEKRERERERERVTYGNDGIHAST